MDYPKFLPFIQQLQNEKIAFDMWNLKKKNSILSNYYTNIITILKFVLLVYK